MVETYISLSMKKDIDKLEGRDLTEEELENWIDNACFFYLEKLKEA